MVNKGANAATVSSIMIQNIADRVVREWRARGGLGDPVAQTVMSTSRSNRNSYGR